MFSTTAFDAQLICEVVEVASSYIMQQNICIYKENLRYFK